MQLRAVTEETMTNMKENEYVYMLRLWKDDDEDWRASLKPLGKENYPAKYFHSVKSLSNFIDKETTGESHEKTTLNTSNH